jgi:hypothetical protein
LILLFFHHKAQELFDPGIWLGIAIYILKEQRVVAVDGIRTEDGTKTSPEFGLEWY